MAAGSRVEVDPGTRFGAPHVRGRSTSVIAGAVWAGEDVETVADEYDLTRGEVFLACWFEAVHGSHGKRRHAWSGWVVLAGPLLAAKDPDYAAIPDPQSKHQRGWPKGDVR